MRNVLVMKNNDKDRETIKSLTVELAQAFHHLYTLPPAIAIFGSARVTPEDTYYQIACKLSALLSDKGYAIITGGGGGIMEAANRGAKKNSVGLNITLPQEQKINRFVQLSIRFKYFCTRKVTFVKYSVGFIVMPGGFGTLDELSEALCLVQTKTIKQFPIVLFGSDFFKPLEDFFRQMVLYRYIDLSDTNYYLITDSITEALEYISNCCQSNKNNQK